MSAEEEAIESLHRAGMLDVLTWAAPAAFGATDQMYDEDAGHDQGVVGYLNFKHLKDLIDRATSSERFSLGEGVDGHGVDVVKRGIPPQVFETMPTLAPDAIDRSNYRQSPGWAAGEYRVLLQSYTFGGVDEIKWSERSDAKRQVAAQYFADDADLALFDLAEYGLQVIAGIPDDDDFAGITLVAAHAFNPVTKQFELYIGQSKNPEHPTDACWHWRHLLLAGGTPPANSGLPIAPTLQGGGASTDVDDVTVRIKKPFAGEEPGTANG